MIKRHAGLRHWGLAILVYVSCLPSAWPHRDVCVLYVGSAEVNRVFIDALTAAMPRYSVRAQSVSGDLPADDTIVVALGPKVLQVLQQRQATQVLVPIFISRVSYRQLVDESDYDPSRLWPIYSDPSPLHQLALIRASFGRVRTTVLLSEKTRFLQPELLASAESVGIALKIRDYKITESARLLGRKLRRNYTKVLLALPDATIYDETTSKPLIKTLNRNSILTVGFSPQMLEFGAVATIHYSIDNIAEAVAEQIAIIKAVDIGKKSFISAKIDYPANYEIAINDRFRLSLNFKRTKTLRRLIAKYTEQISKP